MKIHGNLVNLSEVEVKNRNSNCLQRDVGDLTAKKVKAVLVSVLLVCLCCWYSDTLASEMFPSWERHVRVAGCGKGGGGGPGLAWL